MIESQKRWMFSVDYYYPPQQVMTFLNPDDDMTAAALVPTVVCASPTMFAMHKSDRNVCMENED